MKSRILISLAIITTFTLLYCLNENPSEHIKNSVPHMKNKDLPKEPTTKSKLNDEIRIKEIEPNLCKDKIHSKIIKKESRRAVIGLN